MLLCEFIIILFKEKTHKNPICCSRDLMYPCLMPSFTQDETNHQTRTARTHQPPAAAATGLDLVRPIVGHTCLAVKPFAGVQVLLLLEGMRRAE